MPILPILRLHEKEIKVTIVHVKMSHLRLLPVLRMIPKVTKSVASDLWSVASDQHATGNTRLITDP